MMLTTKLTSIMKFRALYLSEITIFIKFAKIQSWSDLRRYFQLCSILKKTEPNHCPTSLQHKRKSWRTVVWVCFFEDRTTFKNPFEITPPLPLFIGSYCYHIHIYYFTRLCQNQNICVSMYMWKIHFK